MKLLVIFWSLIFCINLSANSDNVYTQAIQQIQEDINNTVSEYTEVKSIKPTGRLTNFIKVDLLYGLEFMSLNITNDIEDVAGSKRTKLSDGGSYSFDSIKLEYKKINISLYDYSFSYELKDNKLVQNNKPGQNNSQSLEDRVNVKIYEIIGGIHPLQNPNAYLNHTSNIQFIKRDAKFVGYYNRGNIEQTFKMDKTKYSLKKILEDTKITKILFSGVKNSFNYYRIDFSKVTAPAVIYSTSTNGKDLDFIDSNFKTSRITLVSGMDIEFDNNVILGASIGAGYSAMEISKKAKKVVKDSGTTNLEEVGGTINYRIGFRLGYMKSFTFEKTELELGFLYDFEWLAEPSQKVADNSGKAQLVFQRREYLNLFKFNARWSF